MRLLAWDTSSKAGALVALEWDPRSSEGRSGLRLAGEWSLNVDATHSDRLLWGIHEMLESARWKLEEIDVFGVGVGPGSFTGLRIGVTTARTLAVTLGKPLVGVSSLAALARPAALWLSEARAKSKSKEKSRVVLVAATDACKGELFTLWGSARSVIDCTAMADGDQPGLWKRGVEEHVLRPHELVKAVKKKLAEGGKQAAATAQWMAIGEGRARYAEAWAELPKSRELKPPVPFGDHVQGRYLGLLAWEAFQAGLGRGGMQVHPRYVRASDAELKLRAGLLPAGPTRGVSEE